MQRNEPGAAIELADVWVQYHLRHAHHYNLKRSLVNFLARRRDDQETITALHGVTLTIPKGARIGLTGPNGSGKSTLLAVMAGTLTPTRGSARTHGRVLALLGGPNEGLDPEQTGRENAISLGVRFGESFERMNDLVDDIRDFSGLGNRFEHPVFTYSSGMEVRLRFSTLTSLDADVLLIDESIGMADSEFSARAARRLVNFYGRAGVLVIASHARDLLAQNCESILDLGLPSQSSN